MENINNSENNNSNNVYDETPIVEILRLMNEHDRQERDEQAIANPTTVPRMIRVPTVINEEDIQEPLVYDPSGDLIREPVYDPSGDRIRAPSREPSGEPMESNFIEDEPESKNNNLMNPIPAPTNKVDEFRQQLESVSIDSSVEPVCSIKDVTEIVENNPEKKEPKCNCIIV